MSLDIPFYRTSHMPLSREFAREWQFNGLPTTRQSDCELQVPKHFPVLIQRVGGDMSAAFFPAQAADWPRTCISKQRAVWEFAKNGSREFTMVDLSDNPSRDNGWSGCLTGKNSTKGGDR
jgi:hypothetical protein